MFTATVDQTGVEAAATVSTATVDQAAHEEEAASVGTLLAAWTGVEALAGQVPEAAPDGIPLAAWTGFEAATPVPVASADHAAQEEEAAPFSTPLAAWTGVEAAAPRLGLPFSATGVAAVGTTVLVMAPDGTGTVTVTVTGVAAHPVLHTVVVA